MELISLAFTHQQAIPKLYTCDGQNKSPPLEIRDPPAGAKSFVLIMDDPDVPAQVRPERMWDHWIAFNIDPSTRKIAEGSNPGVRGKGSYAHLNYGGPCPPPQYAPQEHRYFFKLYAIDIILPLAEGATKKEVETAMQGHILAKAELMGRYKRK